MGTDTLTDLQDIVESAEMLIYRHEQAAHELRLLKTEMQARTKPTREQIEAYRLRVRDHNWRQYG